MRKWIAMALALAMLALPVLGSAASFPEMIVGALEAGRAVYSSETAHVELGVLADAFEDETMQGMLSGIVKLFDSLQVDSYAQKDQAGLTISLNETPILTLAGELAGDSLYVQSNLLGEGTVAMNGEEFLSLLKTLGVELPEQFMALLNMDFSAMTMPSFENTMNAVYALVSAKMETMAVEEVTEQPEGCNPVVYKMTITLTGAELAPIASALAEDLKALPTELLNLVNIDFDEFAANAVKDLEALENLTGVLYFDETGEQIGRVELVMDITGEQSVHVTSITNILTAEEGTSYVTESLTTIDGELKSRVTVNQLISEGTYQFECVVATIEGETETVQMILTGNGVAGMDENGNVSVNSACQLQVMDETTGDMQQVADGTMSVTVDSTTGGMAMTYLVNVTVDPENPMTVICMLSTAENAFSLLYAINSNELNMAYNIDATLNDTDTHAEDEIEVLVHVESGEQVYDIKTVSNIVADKDGDDVTGTVTNTTTIDQLPDFAATTVSLITTGEPQPSMATEDAVRPGKMDEEALNNWVSGVTTNLYTQLITAMQQLPEELLTMLMGNGAVGIAE